MALSVFDVRVRCGDRVKDVTVIDPAGGTVEDCRRYAVHKFGVERVVSVGRRHDKSESRAERQPVAG